jgi:hypothetical protein
MRSDRARGFLRFSGLLVISLSSWPDASLGQGSLPNACDFLQQEYQDARIEELQGKYSGAVASYVNILREHIDRRHLDSEGASPAQCANTQAKAGIIAAELSVTKLHNVDQARALLKEVLALADASQSSRDAAREMLDKLAAIH